jgi:hypothetical protein
MKNNAIIIQHVYGDTPDYYNLLKVSGLRCLEYCQLHQMDYRMIADGTYQQNGDWEKVNILRAILNNEHYKYVIYLDPDTIIADMTADLREACPPNGIGACRHVLTQPAYTIHLDHLNVGALYITNCEASRLFIEKWLMGYPGTTRPSWWEQGVFNDINDGTVQVVDDKYNATGNVNPSPNPVVLGFHGQGDVRQRFNLMCAAIGK